MEIFKHLPLLSGKKADAAEKFDEAVAKEQRIKYHREHVRNGPRQTRTWTNGQIRRAKQRELARQQKRARRRQLDTYFAERQETAVIRAMLTGAHILPSVKPVSAERARDAVIWIASRFAEAPGGIEQVEVTESLVRDAISAACDRYDHLVGQRPGTTMPENYSIPVKFAA